MKHPNKDFQLDEHEYIINEILIIRKVNYINKLYKNS